MAAYARRMVHFVDGRIARDEPNLHPTQTVPVSVSSVMTV